jgi:tetratricopeptide (TPR) repeat protein
MRDRHGFDATVQMYKKRLSTWRARKNYTRQQKEDFIVLLRSHTASHDKNSIRINSKAVKQHRIDRFIRSQSRLPNAADSIQLSKIQLHHSLQYRNVEKCLAEVRYCLHVDFSTVNSFADPLDIPVPDRDPFGQVFESIENAKALLDYDNRTAFAYLNWACAWIPELLNYSKTEFNTVMEILRTLAFSKILMRHREIQLALLRQFGALAETTFGDCHHLTRICSLLQEDVPLMEIARRSAEIVKDFSNQFELTSGAIIAFPGRTSILSQIQRWSRDLYVSAGDLDAVADQLSLLLKQGSLVPNVLAARHYELALVRRNQKRFLEEEKELLEVVRIALKGTRRQTGLSPGIDSCFRLAKKYFYRKDFQKAKHYYTLALDGEIEGFGRYSPGVVQSLRDLADLIYTHGTEEEAAELDRKYGNIHSVLDDYYLHDELGIERRDYSDD